MIHDVENDVSKAIPNKIIVLRHAQLQRTAITIITTNAFVNFWHTAVSVTHLHEKTLSCKN